LNSWPLLLNLPLLLLHSLLLLLLDYALLLLLLLHSLLLLLLLHSLLLLLWNLPSLLLDLSLLLLNLLLLLSLLVLQLLSLLVLQLLLLSLLRLNVRARLLRLRRPGFGLIWPCLLVIGTILELSPVLRRVLIRLAGANLIRLSGADLIRLTGALLLNRTGYRALDAPIGDQRTSDSSGSRTAMVLTIKLLAVLCCLALVLDLSGHRPRLRAAHGGYLRGPRPHLDAASSAVIGDPCVVVVVDDDGAVVDVGDPGHIDPIHCAVVVEVVAVPITAMIAIARVSEAIGNTAVEAYVKAPVAAVEAIAVAIETPIAGGPERTIIGRHHPRARNPVVAYRSIVPIAGGPDIVGAGGFGLLIGGQRRWGLIGLFHGLLPGIDLIVVVLIVLVGVVLIVGILIVGILIVGVGLVLLLSCGLRGTILLILNGLLLALILNGLALSRRLCRGLSLISIDRGHIGIGRISARAIRCLSCDGLPVASRKACHTRNHCDTHYESQPAAAT